MRNSVLWLRGLIVIHLVWTFLLTPLALEPRPFSVITAIGYASLVLIFTVVALDIVVLVIAGRSPRLAGLIAAIGPFLLVGPVIGDQVGLFATVPPPAVITALELLALATQVAIFFVALRLRRQTGATT
jgi:hypothetical protein